MSCETNRQRTGRPPDVPNDVMLKTRLKLAESKTGWDFSQVMDVIYTKTGRRYHELGSVNLSRNSYS
ncbi:MAG: hypothetical protein MRJ93_00110 [Nitrososphaeraceae archaeon]|nr:hypothetical protein [Nitrososphaeraceae archaeon]